MLTKHSSVLLSLFLALFFSTTITAQRGWGTKAISSVDIMLGGDMNFRLLSPNKDATELAQQQNRNHLESHRLNYRYGINYNHGIGRNLLVKVGVRVANPGLTVGKVTDFDIHQSINEIQKMADIRGAEYHYKYQIVELPVGFRYVLSGVACEPYIEVTTSANFYRNTVVEERPYEGVARQYTITEDIKDVYFIGNLAFGGDFTISRRFSGYTQMVARYQLDKLRTNGLSEKMISFGFEVGLRHYLR